MMGIRASLRVLVLLLLVHAAPGGPAFAQEQHPATTPPHSAGAQPTTPGSQPEHAEEEAHGSGVDMIARLVNFALLAGILTYFLKKPIAGYLASRSTQIRQDLVTAADMRKTASAQLDEIRRRMQALPGELEALRTRGAEDVHAEKARIAQAAAAERERLIDQTRREIDMRLRIARRELTEHAAQLAVQVASERIKRTITNDDQVRLLDRYTSQLKEAR